MDDRDEMAALVRQGVAEAEQGLTDRAVATLERALAMAPRDPQLHWMVGTALRAGGRAAEARARYEAALAIDPAHAGSRANLAALLAEEGTALNRQGRGADAIAWFDRAIALRPDAAGFHINRGIALRQAGRLEESIAAFDRALALKPGDPLAHWNRGLSLLGLGRLDEGWREYEYRLRLPSAPGPVALPMWDGRGPCRLLVRREQGLGDEILFASCVDLLEQGKVDKYLLECDARLAPLFRRSFPRARILPVRRPGPGEKEPPPVVEDAEAWIAAGSLPRLFRPTLGAFPARRAYLLADPALLARWRGWLDGLGEGRKIGLCWRSSQAGGARDLRYARVTDLQPLFALAEARCVSLQLNLDDAERATAAGALAEAPGLDLRDDIDGVAALIAGLDLVVTVDSWILSLAGALGVATVVLAAQRAWASLGTDRVPWLPAVALRSVAGGGFGAAIGHVASELARK
ncbi:MAG: tetratricopeptide repeat protein [Alphaproteobacteria bacterium]|nr:tetratricopeptide repeat protein [Alphaproteobacteria bacterium]